MYKATSRAYQKGKFPIQRWKGSSYAERAKKLKAGQLVWGKVSKLNTHGAVVEVNGVRGFLHISEIANRWVDNPSDILKIDEVISLKILSSEIDEKGRICIKLSRKAVSNGPKGKSAHVKKI
jgi:small subunit ribosomal protein S1